MSKLEILRDKYFDALEENCVEFSYQEDIGNGQTETVIKEEYLYKSIKDMCEYLELPEWITNWTIDMIGEDLAGELIKIKGIGMPGFEGLEESLDKLTIRKENN